jgi:hypothetical protein
MKISVRRVFIFILISVLFTCFILLTVPVFSATTYNVTASCTKGGTINPMGKIPVIQGRNITFVITPDTGYMIDRLFVDKIPVSVSNQYTFRNVISSHSIYATFRRNTSVPLPGPIPVPTQGGNYSGSGYYSGKYTGNSEGIVGFNVRGNSISGIIRGTFQGKYVTGEISGKIDSQGNVTGSILGAISTTQNYGGEKFPFSGDITGVIKGLTGSGSWTAKLRDGNISCNWNIKRQ